MKHPVANHYLNVKKHHPELVNAVEKLGETCKNAGPLDRKTAHLIQIAAAIAIKSEGSVHSHTKRALEEGANHQEIRHAVILLTNTIGFPNVMAGMTWVNDILDAV